MPKISKKPRANFGKVEQVKEGVPHKYNLRPDGTAVAYTICCDCGLTHLEEFTPRKSYIRVRVWREDERTEHQRKKAHIRISKLKRKN